MLIKLVSCVHDSGEVSGTVSRTGARWRNGKVVDGIELTGDTKVKIIRYGAVRYIIGIVSDIS